MLYRSMTASGLAYKSAESAFSPGVSANQNLDRLSQGRGTLRGHMLKVDDAPALQLLPACVLEDADARSSAPPRQRRGYGVRPSYFETLTESVTSESFREGLSV